MLKNQIPEERTCCKCGSTKTEKNFNGSPLWYKYKDKNDIWDRRSYVCKTCYNLKRTYGTYNIYEIENKKNEYSRNKMNGRKCCKCEISGNYKDIQYKYYDDKWNWDRKSYLCKSCWDKDPKSNNTRNLIKSMAKCRLIGFDKDSNNGKAIMSQAVIAKFLKVEDLNIKMDNFNYYIDIEYYEHGKIDVKAEAPNDRDKWGFRTRRKLDCDTYFCIGMDDKWNNIEMVLIIPNDECITDISMITISRYPKYSSIYDHFKVDPEPYNYIYHDLLSYLKDINPFSIDDINKWLKNG